MNGVDERGAKARPVTPEELIEVLEASTGLMLPGERDAAVLHALADALREAQERCALRRPDGSIIWDTLSDPGWGARRRADGMEVFDYVLMPAVTLPSRAGGRSPRLPAGR